MAANWFLVATLKAKNTSKSIQETRFTPDLWAIDFYFNAKNAYEKRLLNRKRADKLTNKIRSIAITIFTSSGQKFGNKILHLYTPFTRGAYEAHNEAHVVHS